MIKKTLRNAAVGMVAAGAMILPAATTVAPQLQLVACDYPDSKDTATDQQLSKYVAKKGKTKKIRSFVTVSNLDGEGSPNGTITVTMYGPNGGVQKVKSKPIRGPKDTRKFTFGGFKKKQQGAYRFLAEFEGFCKFSDSSDEDYAVVTR